MNATYFEDPTTRLQHDGKEIGVIKKGDTQTTVNEKLAAELEQLKNQISKKEPLSAVSSSNIANESSFGFNKDLTDSGQRISLKVEPQDDKVFVSYTFNIADGAEIITADISLEGNRAGSDAVLNSSKKTTSGFYLSPNNFPATLNFNATQKTSTGTENLTAKIQLQPSGDSAEYTVFKRNINTSDLKTQKEVNEFLYSEVNRLNKTTKENKINYKGVEKTLTEVVIELMNEVSELRKLVK